MLFFFASVVLWRNVFLPDITVMVDGVKKIKKIIIIIITPSLSPSSTNRKGFSEVRNGMGLSFPIPFSYFKCHK